MVKHRKYSKIISQLRDAWGVFILVGCVPKKKKRGEETTEEVNEKSEELEGKNQGAHVGGSYSLLRQIITLVLFM